jgi:uncharacterized protein (TIRG00374 family)
MKSNVIKSSIAKFGEVFQSPILWVFLIFLSYSLWFIVDENLSASMLLALPVPLLFLLCGITFLSLIIRFLRWHVMLMLVGHKLPVLWHFNCYVAGLAFTATPGKAGETVRSVFLARKGVPYGNSLGLFVCDRFCDLLSLVLWGLAFLSMRSLIPMGMLAFIVALFVLSLYFIRSSIADFCITWASTKTRNNYILRALGLLKRVSEALMFYFSPMRLLCCVGLGLVAWSLVGLQLQIVLSHFGSPVSFLDAMGVTSIGLIAGAASLIPGGLGVNELAQSHVLGLLGVKDSVGFIAIVTTRITTLWFAIALGACSLFLLGVGRRIYLPRQGVKLKNTQKDSA